METGETDSYRAEMRIGLAHGHYKPLTIKKTMKIPGEFFVHDYIRGDKLLDVGTLTLDPQ